jgi:hypothetical protein
VCPQCGTDNVPDLSKGVREEVGVGMFNVGGLLKLKIFQGGRGEDDIPRPRFDRAAESANKQFSLVSNTEFQFWDAHANPPPHDPQDGIRQAWWYQATEPEVPKGWRASCDWWEDKRIDGTGLPPIKCRILYHEDETRSLDADQLGVVQLPVGG